MYVCIANLCVYCVLNIKKRKLQNTRKKENKLCEFNLPFASVFFLLYSVVGKKAVAWAKKDGRQVRKVFLAQKQEK